MALPPSGCLFLVFYANQLLASWPHGPVRLACTSSAPSALTPRINPLTSTDSARIKCDNRCLQIVTAPVLFFFFFFFPFTELQQMYQEFGDRRALCLEAIRKSSEGVQKISIGLGLPLWSTLQWGGYLTLSQWITFLQVDEFGVAISPIQAGKLRLKSSEQFAHNHAVRTALRSIPRH